MINFINTTTELSSDLPPTVIYEDNQTAIKQISEGFIKSDLNKHFLPKFFYTSEQQQLGEIDVQYVASEMNLADIFTKSLGPESHWRIVPLLGLFSLKEIGNQNDMMD